VTRPTNRPLTVAALLLAMFMAAIEATVVGTAMPTVVADLGGLSMYGWVGSAYLLASTVTVPVYGKLADLYGRKPILLFAIVVFLLGSIGCGLAPSIGLLVAARALQGIGAGGMQPIALTVVGDLFTVAERGRIQGFFGAVWGISGILGPLAGGVLVRWSWRLVFLVNVPFGIASMLILAFALHEAREKVVRPAIDWGGAITLTLAAICVLLGAGGSTIAIAVAIVFVGAFVAVERRAKDPVLALDLVVRRPIAVGSLAGALLGASMMATILYVPLWVQGVLGRTPTEAGITIAPMLVGWPIASTISGRLIPKLGFRTPVWVGSACIALSLGTFSMLLAPDTGLFTLRALMFAYGLGMGFVNTALIVAVQSSVQWKQRGVATATTMFSRTIGGAIGVGALGALLARRLGAELPEDTVTALLDPHRRASVTADPHVTELVAKGLTPVFLTAAAIAVVNLAVVAFWPREVASAEREAKAEL